MECWKNDNPSVNEQFVLNMATLQLQLLWKHWYVFEFENEVVGEDKKREDNLSCLLTRPTSLLTHTVHMQFTPI